MNISLVILGKIIIFLSRVLNFGSGSTWSGHIALLANRKFIKSFFAKSKVKIILIAGTNGKTTTGKIIQTILEEDKKFVFQNQSGANLLNGIASALIHYSNFIAGLDYDYAILEVDENTLPLILKEVFPNYIILLNLFRDQLDRYGEVNIITNKWSKALRNLSSKTTLILNADDPQIASLGTKTYAKTYYFGVLPTTSNASLEHASDSIYCPKCSNKLDYKNVTFSHLGNWDCKNCGFKRPKIDFSDFNIYPLPGLYNKYNTHAAVLLVKMLGVSDNKIKTALKNFKPAFGRQEIVKYNKKNVQIFLSKNPTSFNQSLSTINTLAARYLLIVLNDRIPDGRDVSWIWDVDFENNLENFKSIFISGDRPYDMGLRLKYSIQNSHLKQGRSLAENFKIYEDLKKAIDDSLKGIKSSDTLYILPTYSAMLDLRKILTGKKIL